MKGINRTVLLGNLGADPIRRTTKNGNPVVHFPMATSRKVKKGEEGVEETQWHQIVAWGKLAETCEKYLSKGRKVYVEGSVRTRRYESKEGEPRVSYEVHAENVIFIDSKKGSSSNSPEETLAQAV